MTVPCIEFLVDVPDNADIASEEIFGPVLSVYAYDDIKEVVNYINSRPSPLAAYWYGKNDELFNYFLNHTTSGGVTLNDCIYHTSGLREAPFGGIGNSGSGAYHGKTGFDIFTHRRTVATLDHELGLAEPYVNGNLHSKELAQAANEKIASTLTSI